MEDRTHDGRTFLMPNVVDEFTRKCLAICVDRRLRSTAVIDVLSDLFIPRGVPGHIRSDNEPEFVAKTVQAWGSMPLAPKPPIEPGNPWENGYDHSKQFNRMTSEHHELPLSTDI
jgi:hypothetical protein